MLSSLVAGVVPVVPVLVAVLAVVAILATGRLTNAAGAGGDNADGQAIGSRRVLERWAPRVSCTSELPVLLYSVRSIVL